MGSFWGPWLGLLWTLSLVAVSAQEHQVVHFQMKKMGEWRVQLLADPLVAIAAMCPHRQPPNLYSPGAACLITVMGRKDHAYQDICQAPGHSDQLETFERETSIRKVPQGPRWYQIQLACAPSFQENHEKKPILSYRIKR